VEEKLQETLVVKNRPDPWH